MKIIIIGAGTVGFSLAEYLSRQKYSVSVIESDTALCRDINAKLDVFTVNGHGSSLSALEDAGIQEADMIVAATPNDETNLLACSFARQYGVAKRIARIKSAEYTKDGLAVSLEQIGVTHVVEPEKEVVRNILQYIELPGVTESANFQSDNVYLRGYRIKPEMPLHDKTLSEVTQLAGPAPMLIVVIIRDGKSILPSGEQRLLAGDEIVAIMPRESFPTFRALLGHTAEKLGKVVLSGDTLTAIHLAGALKPLVERVVLLDPSEEHGRTAAAQLEGVEVLFGDSTDSDILEEVHIETAGFFIAAGKDTEDNVMSCLLAKAEGASEVVAINNSDRHAGLFHSLGLDHIINPRKITAQAIISSVLRVPISAHLGLDKVNIAVTRFVAEKKSRIVNKPLHRLNSLFKKSIVIGAVMREDQVIIPRGDTVIRENDEVIVLCHQDSSKLANRLFKAGPTITV